MTQEQNEFIKSVLGQITVNATAPESVKTIEMIQSILVELEDK